MENAIAPRFASYDEAVRFARASYTCEEDDTSESSFIRSATFCESAETSGYLILDLNGREYVYESVPETVWDGFKHASSKGQYYNAELRGRYRLELAD